MHTFGSRLTWHPHEHASLTLGGMNVYGDWKNLAYRHENVEQRWRHKLCDFLLSEYASLSIEDTEHHCRDFDEFRCFVTRKDRVSGLSISSERLSTPIPPSIIWVHI
ncbi:transposase [Vibrio sinus]|uniref:transposase n=1 Tax=Vibrio sinus TaxID=2946865 RepID=UPI003D7E0681